jgi:hypothetical protein
VTLDANCRRWSAIVAVALLLALSGAARAQTADEQAARAIFKEGVALHEAGNFAGAIEKYRAAYARWKNPKILTNVGTVAWELGRFVEAAEAYDQYLADAAPNDPSRAEVEKALAEVVPKVATLDVDAARGARVTIDGRAIEHGRLDRIRVEPGTHTVEASSAGSTVKQSVDAKVGSTARVSLVGPAPAAVQPAAGAPSEEPRTSPGARHDRVPLIIGAIGATSLIASGAFFLLHNGAKSDLDERCMDGVCPSSSQSDIDSAETYGTVSLITLGIGVAGVGTAIWMLSNPKTDPQAPVQARLGVMVTAGPSMASAAARLQF